MSTTQTPQEAVLVAVPPGQPRTAPRWRHPFDSATGTVALGVLLTIVLVLALRLLNG